MKFVVADIINKNFNKYSLEETLVLIKNYGGNVEKIFLQNRNTPSSASYIGTGKAREIARFCLDNKIDVFVINSMLKPSVYNTLRDYFPWEVNIWDKIDLILNIFDKHSKTKEAKLQIEYAKIKYELPRLKGRGKQLSNLGAGIGTRGPGEKIMEIKKRHYEKRLLQIEKEIKQREDVLSSQRQGRKFYKKALLLGYSNVGKSTLFNALTGKEVYIEDILFATLDNRVGKLKTHWPIDILVIDTIGFINGIPPLILNSFLPTLEEIKYADYYLVVFDVSLIESDIDYFELQFNTVKDILIKFKHYVENKTNEKYENLRGEKSIILVFNKADKLKNKVDINSYVDQFKKDFNVKVFYWVGSAFFASSLKDLILSI